MNVFWKELKSRRISLLAWSAAIVIFLFMCMVKFQTLSSDSTATAKLLDQFPDTLQAVFGMSGLDASQLGGYYGMCFIFVMILVAVHAGTTGVGLLASEAQMKTTEFLYTKPAPRTRIITAKLGAGVLQLVVVWAAAYLGSIWSIKSVTSMGEFGHDLAVFMAATAIIQFVFFALGMLFAAVARSANAPAKWMSGAVFATYILSVLAQFSGYGAFRHLSVFSYFKAADILRTGSLRMTYVAVCAAAGFGALVAAYLIYRRRDLLV